jgi:hypothetical protein
MARGTREELLTHADQCINDLGRAIVNLTSMADLYGDVHPEYKAACLAFVEMLNVVAALILQFKLEKM